jgi:predicted nucleotide-binding protein
MSVEHVTLAQARDRLEQRLRAGRELLERSSSSAVEDDLQQMRAQFTVWHNSTMRWLGQNLPSGVSDEFAEPVGAVIENGDPATITLLSVVLPLEISALESILDRLALWIDEPEVKSSEDLSTRAAPGASIFIVHGSDTLRAESVAHTVTRATGRKTVILREQPNFGRTLIEKFEQHAAEISYAIIILTPDDKGCRAAETDTRPRGRQNVIFEMGYFYGLIGRANVSVLLSPGVEEPSDTDGIGYINFDDTGAWKAELFRELRNVGFEINF